MSVPFIIDKAISYSDVFTTSADPLLQIILDETRAAHPKAHMLSGEVQGQFLSILSCIKCPMHILEIGTFTGYSALCLAKGLDLNGKLHTIENRTEDAEKAARYFANSQDNHKIELHVGDAKEIIPALPFAWDIVFIDANKTGYIEYYEMVVPLLATGGIIIADNVLWSGKILDHKELAKDNDTKELDAFNKKVHDDPRVENILLPIRDGLMVVRKL